MMRILVPGSCSSARSRPGIRRPRTGDRISPFTARRGTIVIYSRSPRGSMARVMIVKEGEAWREGEIWHAFPTTVLIESNGRKVLVDPGNHPSLLEFLERRSVWKEDIDMIFATHHHPDHTMNIGWFPGVPVVDGEYVYEETRISPHSGRIPGTDIDVIPTPGHSPEHASLLVRSPEASTVICGDLIWWTRDEAPFTDREWFMGHPDEFAEDPEQLARSRERVLSLEADIHIPGHGKPFMMKENPRDP